MSDQVPGGTVYGRGGADPRPPKESRSGLHPAVLALVCGAALMLVVALGYWFVRDPADDLSPVAAPVTSPASSPASSPVAAESPSAKAAEKRLSTGSWVVAARDDPERVLRRSDDFAAVERGDPMTVSVVRGLADRACFSFRDERGDYLRHFDYRLRFDGDDESELFRADATFCPEDGASVRLRSKNYPDHVVHRRGSELYIDKPDGSDRFTADSSFALREPS